MPAEALLREVVASLQAERDDALAYLGTLRSILETAGSTSGLRTCAHDAAHVLVAQLAVESAALLLRDEEGRRPTLLGFATQAERFGPPADQLPLATWIAAAERCGTGRPVTWLRPAPSGALVDLSLDELDGESIQILPFAVSDDLRGTLVLHRLAAPAQRFVHATASRLIADSVGEALTIARARDVTARLTVQLEQQLGVAQEALNVRDKTLLERERAISSLTDKIVRSNEVKTRFLGAISHELRTPLNAIVGFACLLREDAGHALTGEHLEMLDGIVNGGKRLSALVDDVLLLIQLEAGSYRPSRDSLDLSALVASALAEVAPHGGAVDFDVAIAPGANGVEGDERLLRRILVHLLGNSHKFTTSGSVTVRAEPQGLDGDLALEVADTGDGMAPEHVETIFELFASEPGSEQRATAGGGLGLGLTLVDRAMLTLGGALSVESSPGVGTVFRLVIPSALPAGGVAAASASTA